MDLYRLWRILYHGCSSKVKQSKGYKVMLSKPIFHENWLILTGAAVFLVLRTFSDLNLHSVIMGSTCPNCTNWITKMRVGQGFPGKIGRDNAKD